MSLGAPHSTMRWHFPPFSPLEGAVTHGVWRRLVNSCRARRRIQTWLHPVETEGHAGVPSSRAFINGRTRS